MKIINSIAQHINGRVAILLLSIVALLIGTVASSIGTQAATSSSISANAFIAARCQTTDLVGHRGASAPNVKNNTIPAFKLAVQSGVKVIEFDIHKTKKEKGTSQWVVYHDKTIKGRAISKTTYSKLKKLEPSLITYRQAMAYLSTVKTVRVFAEIKPSKISKASARYIGRVVNEYKMRPRVEIHSFHKGVLTKFRKYNSGFRIGFIMNKVKYSPSTIRKFANSVVINKSLIYGGKVSVSGMKSQRLAVYAYTPNNSTEWTKLINYGVSGVITDYGKAYKSWCAGIQPKPVTPPPVVTPPVEPPAPVDPVPAEPEDPTEPTDPVVPNPA